MKGTKVFIGRDYLARFIASLFNEDYLNSKKLDIQILTTMISHYIDHRDKKIFEHLHILDSGIPPVLLMLDDILEMKDEPLPIVLEPQFYHELTPGNLRRRTRVWNRLEDKRLLAGVYRFGIDNWTKVANYVGSGRTRSQCAQRWARNLDPSIRKDKWSIEEEEKLKYYVEKYGIRSWTKISSLLGNRSDVQCRYHYHNIMKQINEHQNSHVATIQHLTYSDSRYLVQTKQHQPTQSPPNLIISAPQPVYILLPKVYFVSNQANTDTYPSSVEYENDQLQKEELDSFLKYFK